MREHRTKEQTIVFTNGCFDILHSGHIELLRKAKSQGDILVVAINSDTSISALKGDKRPILKEEERAFMLEELESIDYVTIFNELDPLEIIKKISPDVLVKGSDWKDNIIGTEWVEDHGGEVHLIPLVKGYSTTNIIDFILKNKDN